MNDFPFLFLTRAGCHLCEDAWPVVRAAAKRARVRIEAVDIEQRDDLLSRFVLRIPVVLAPTGRVLAEGRIDDRRSLARAMKDSSPG
ncbi:MAG: glutaredoxin family protein [Acidimicrobiia bacterium]|nr:glutaredoxin family protein [Acidimicrobiia bacterium]